MIRLTQCNRCISSGGGDCATCTREPDFYTASEQSRHDIGIGICEYQKRWETACQDQNTTDFNRMIKYVSYSCALFFCKYPERKCEVKK